MPEIVITIRNKIATASVRSIVCDNTDYTVRLDCDGQWGEGPKIVYFALQGVGTLAPATTEDDVCAVPPIRLSDGVGRQLAIGVQQGAVKTSSAAHVFCWPSAEDELIQGIHEDDGVDLTWLEWVNANMAQAAINVETAQGVLAEAQAAADEAEQARDDAVSAKTDAETAAEAAESAKDGAETAKTAAQTAAAQAAASESSAETAAEEAESAKDDAVTAKTAAETASATATGASEAATVAKDDAVTARNAAQTAETGAVEAKNAAVSAKEAAQSAASSAGTSATNANNSAGTAEYYAENAETAAETATTKASEASASATTASSAATTATEAKNTAVSSASTATTKAGEASTSATSAASSAAAAQAVKDSIPEDYSELSEDVSELKTKIEVVEDQLSETTELEPVLGSENRAIAVGGRSLVNATGYNVYRARVVDYRGKTLVLDLKSYGAYQPAVYTDNTGITTGFIDLASDGSIIPATAHYVMFTSQNADNDTVGYRNFDVIEKINNDIEALDLKIDTETDQAKADIKAENAIINVNFELKTTTNYTLESAINAVWDNLRTMIKKGVVLIYKTTTATWESRQFIVADNSVSEAQWKNLAYWKPFVKNTRSCIVLAASDSSAEAKESADLTTNTASAGIALINSAVALLPNGGRIYLRNGTYSGADGVSITVPNITIEGESLGVTIARTSGNDIFSSNIKGTILRNIRATKLNLYNGSEYILDNCIINNELLDYSYPSLEGVFVPPSKGIAGINSEIIKMGENGGTILLGEGEYTGSDALNFYKSSSPTGYKSNIRIVGRGYRTVIDRTDSNNDVVANSDAISNNILENVRIANRVQRTVANPVKMLRLISCWVGTTYVDESDVDAVNIVNIGKGRLFETYSAAYDMFTANTYPISPTARWEFHIYGHIVETAPVILQKSYIDLIGHNAVIELRGKAGVRFTFADPGNEYYGYSLGTVRDIHFLKTGCYNYYQNYCVFVTSDTVRFFNCIFENASSSPTPFDQRNYAESQEATAGARRHGIGIECKKWGSQCKTEFHDCVGIGSPYGFMNTRGWYIVFGSPKLFNCVGYGGGIGEFCHGIISHRSSQAELIGCIGYASKTAFRKSAGIRFQAAGSSHLIGCIGYGSGGTQYISEGVSASRVTEICNSLGIDPSIYVINGVVQYSALTDEICAEISNDDITLTPLNTNTEEGYGISFWANDGTAHLMNCEGYAGSGNNSHGLHIIRNAKPTINGGYYGIKDMLQNISVVSNSGNDMVTKIGGELNDYSKYTVTQITVSITGGVTSADDLFYVETDETNPKTIVDGFDLKGVASIAIMPTVKTTIDAGVGLKIYIVRNGSKINISGGYLMHVQYNYAGDNSSAVFIDANADPLITNAIIRADDNSDAVEIGSSYAGSAVRMYDCALHGDVDSGVVFAARTAVNGSSNYSI